MKISIIIPVKNERRNFNYIDQLLDCLKNQTVKPLETIISDAEYGKEDYDADLVIEGGLPAIARNNAARKAKGDYLLFLDADMYIKEDFLEKSIEEIKKRELDIASVKLLPYFHDLSKTNKLAQFFDNVVYVLYNGIVGIYQHTKKPFANGRSIFVKKNLFEELKGFDESLPLWEDWDFTVRSAKKGKFRFLKSTKAYHSSRRFNADGRFNYISKIAFNSLNLKKGLQKSREGKIDYKFDHYD